jgi:hypothetical protein
MDSRVSPGGFLFCTHFPDTISIALRSVITTVWTGQWRHRRPGTRLDKQGLEPRPSSYPVNQR